MFAKNFAVFAVVVLLAALAGCSGEKEKNVRILGNKAWEAQISAMQVEDRLQKMAKITLRLAQDSLEIAKAKLAEAETHNRNILAGVKNLRQAQLKTRRIK
ncbi:MAG: hypothetical protein Q7S34_00930 [bacterium]|nr:hypothetical protein [bacterium]